FFVAHSSRPQGRRIGAQPPPRQTIPPGSSGSLAPEEAAKSKASTPSFAKGSHATVASRAAPVVLRKQRRSSTTATIGLRRGRPCAVHWTGRQDGTRSMAASPYGFWTSPLTSDLVIADSIRLEQVALDGDAI